MGSKIGRKELEIIEYLQQKGEETYAQMLINFSPTIIAPTGKKYSQFNICEDRLIRMKEKGLVVIEKKSGLRFVRLVNDLHIN